MNKPHHTVTQHSKPSNPTLTKMYLSDSEGEEEEVKVIFRESKVSFSPILTIYEFSTGSTSGSFFKTNSLMPVPSSTSNSSN